MIRLAKAACVGAVALYMALVAFGNVTDYGTNFAFVAHVFDMDAIFPDSTIRWRAIQAPWMHHLAYLLIIAVEIAVAALCAAGTAAMLRARTAPAADFRRAKTSAVAGLALGFMLYEVGFVAIGGEWFGMWQSQQWNGVASAFRIALTMMAVLIFVALPDEEAE